MTPEKEFLTIAEFAKKTSLHPATVRRMLASGRLQGLRISSPIRGTFRIPITELDRLCERGMEDIIEKVVEKKLEERNVQG